MIVKKYNNDFFIINMNEVYASSCEEDILYNIPKEYVSKWQEELPEYVEIKRDVESACTCHDEKCYVCPYSYWNNIDLGCSKTFDDGRSFKETIHTDEVNNIIIVSERYPEKIFNITDKQFPQKGEKMKVYIEDIESWVDGEYIGKEFANVYFFPQFPQKTRFNKWKIYEKRKDFRPDYTDRKR